MTIKRIKVPNNIHEYKSFIPGVILLTIIFCAVGISYGYRNIQKRATYKFLGEVESHKNTKESLNKLTDYNVSNILWEDKEAQRLFSVNHTDLHASQYPWVYVNEDVEISGSIQDQYIGDADWERSITHKRFDIDDDGVAEDIVLFNTAMNHRPHGVHVYKNNHRILTIRDVVYGDALQSKTGKGFFVKTADYDEGDNFRGYCCPNETVYAYFVFKDDALIPLWETEIPVQDSASSE